VHTLFKTLAPMLVVLLLGLLTYLYVNTYNVPPQKGATRPVQAPVHSAPATAAARSPGQPDQASYRVTFSIFEDRSEDYSQLTLLKDVVSGKIGRSDAGFGAEKAPVNYGRALQEIRDWLEQHGLSSHDYSGDDPEPGQDARPDVCLSHYGHFGNSFTLHIFQQPRSTVDDLQQDLLDLRGVHDLEVAAGTPVFEGGRHEVFAEAQLEVRIEGRAYRYPADFNQAEQSMIMGRVVDPARPVYYMAFFAFEPGVDRFGFGDIVRLGWDGTLPTFDTVVEKWNISATQRKQLLSGDLPVLAYYTPDDRYYSIGIQLPADTAETDFDVLAAFDGLLQLDPSIPRWDERPTANVYYELRTEEQLARLTGRQLRELAAAPEDAALVQAGQAAFDAWLAAHPQYRNIYLFPPPVQFSAGRESGVLLGLRIHVAADDPLAVARDIAASLNGIPGLPEPEITEHEPYGSK
jgi:hypothetical protein